MPKVVTINGRQETVLSRTEAAERLGVTPRTIWMWVAHGTRGRKLGSVLLGGMRVYLPEQLDAFVQTTPTTALPVAEAPVEKPKTPEDVKQRLRARGYKV